MKNIITTHITDSARLPLMARTLNWINLGIKETVANSVYAQLNSNDDSVPIVLWGCIPTYSTVTTTNDTLHLTAGAIIQGGEVFYFGDTTVTKTGTDVFVIQDYYVNQTSEPTKYTDSTLYPTNVDHQLNLVAGATGSGICDWANVKFLRLNFVDIGGGFFLRKEGNQLCITGENGSISSGILTTFATNIIDGIEPITGIDRISSTGGDVFSTGVILGNEYPKVVRLEYLGGPNYILYIEGTIGDHVFLDCSFSLKTRQ